MVLAQPHGTGLLFSTLRSPDEPRAAEFPKTSGKIDGELVALAEAIIDHNTGSFGPASFRDRYQDALHELAAKNPKGEVMAAPPAS